MSLATEIAVWAEWCMPGNSGSAIAAELRRLDASNKELLEALEAALVAMQNAESIMAAVKVALDRDIPLGDPVHAQSSRLTFPAADLKFASESARAAIAKARGQS